MGQRIKIIANPQNPDTQEVIDAFANAYSPSRRVYLILKTEDDALVPYRSWIELKVIGLTYESGTPGMFEIRGWISRLGNIGPTQVMGFYNADKREGWLEIKE